MRSISGFCRNSAGSTGGKLGLVNPIVGSLISEMFDGGGGQPLCALRVQRLPQGRLVDLADRVLRQLLDNVYRDRELDLGEIAPAPLEQILRRDRGVRVGDHVCHRDHTGTSPYTGCGAPMTAASRTASSPASTDSISLGYTFSPPRMIMSLIRSTRVRYPSPSRKPTSPVCSQPPASVSAVASGRLR